jgi:uncharacterized protein YrrD
VLLERYSEVVGLPVLCADNGKRLGTVKDVIFSPRHKCVFGLLLERKGTSIWGKLIRLKDILSLGRDAVIINDSSCLTAAKDVDGNEEYKSRGKILGLRIFAKSGKDLGVIEDVMFDYRSGHIEGVEVSDGLLQDIYKGRRILPLFGKFEFSQENLLVDREALEEMTDTGGGISKILQDE